MLMEYTLASIEEWCELGLAKGYRYMRIINTRSGRCYPVYSACAAEYMKQAYTLFVGNDGDIEIICLIFLPENAKHQVFKKCKSICVDHPHFHHGRRPCHM